MSSFLTSIQESARGFLCSLSASIRLRSHSLFNSSRSSNESHASNLPYKSTVIDTASNLGHPSIDKTAQQPLKSIPATLPVIRVTENLIDGDFELQMPSKQRYESEFSYQYQSRNSSSSTLFIRSSTNIRQNNLKSIPLSIQQQPTPTSPPLQQEQKEQNLPSQKMSMAQQELQRGQGHRGSWEKGVEGIADTVTALSIPASLRSVSLEPSSLLVLHSTPTLAVHTDPCYGGHKAAKVTPEAITEIEDAAQVEMEVLFPANNSDATQGKILPDTVLIHDLPEYFPDDGFGRNSRRYEKYARLRLVALREHQQALVRLLGELLDTDNLYRLSQDRLLPPVSTACPHDRIQESETGSSRNQCACHIRRVHRRQKRETAVSGYQKAILDLWQTDQNLCYWLSRYIRTTRRVGRSLDFILTSTGDSNPSTTAIAPLDQHKVGSNNGVSNPELERMGILQSRLLNYVACPASCTTSYVSTTLPPADELLKERCASTSRSKSRSNGKTVPQSTQSALSSITEVKEASMSFKKPTNDFARDPAQQSFSPADESAPLSQQSMALDASIPISVAIKDIPVIPAIVSKRIVVMTSRSIMASLPLSPLLPAPSTPPPAVPAPSPPRQYGTSPSPNLSATIQHPRSAPVHTPSQSQQPVQRQEMRQITTSGRVRTCFRDLDEFETAVFVGFHMQSLQKTNEFLHQFNKEAIRSRIMTERFKIARDMYEHRVMGRPWKTQQRKKELLRTKCSSNNV